MKTKISNLLVWTGLLFLTANSLSAQLDYKLNQILDSMKVVAFQNIVELKQNYVIVRLNDNKMKIQALRKAGGGAKYADEIEIKQKEENQKIVNGFVENYDFSQVYFIHTSEYKKWKNGEEACFLNTDLACDPLIKPADLEYYIVDFDFVRQSKIGSPGRSQGAGDVRYNGDVNLRKLGIVVLNKNNEQLEKPFPNFVGETVWFFKQDPKVMVRKLNENFKEFHFEALKEF